MKRLTLTDYIIIFLLLVMIAAMITMIIATKEARRTCEMKFDKPINGVNGYWHIDPSGEYMCVWLNGRTLQEINDTIDHESLHALIAHDYDHFCGDY